MKKLMKIGAAALVASVAAGCASVTYSSPGMLDNVSVKGVKGRKPGQAVLIDTSGFYMFWTVPLVSGDLRWNDEKKYINPRLLQNPILQTNAPINQHFRVLDENELDRIEEKSDASRAALEAQASRTFVFKLNSTATLYKYTLNGYSEKWENGYYAKAIDFKGNVSGVKHVIDLLDLEPNKKYRLNVSGYAKEIVGGKEVNPVTFNEQTHKYVNKAWSQSKNYYFQTGPEKAIEDVVDLQEYVAIAYPSYLS